MGEETDISTELATDIYVERLHRGGGVRQYIQYYVKLRLSPCEGSSFAQGIGFVGRRARLVADAAGQTVASLPSRPCRHATGGTVLRQWPHGAAIDARSGGLARFPRSAAGILTLGIM